VVKYAFDGFSDSPIGRAIFFGITLDRGFSAASMTVEELA
jgi:hypothetical protein